MSFSRLIIFMALALCISCASESKEADNLGKPAKTANVTAPSKTKAAPSSNSIVSDINLPTGSTPKPPVQRPPEPAQNADGVWHYTCAKGCPGGAGKADPCATCGQALKHNTAYHAKPPGQAGQAVSAPNIQAQPGGANPIQMTQPPRPTEPAQNTAGVWHFTCPKGCAGGGGAKGPCGKCGGELAHNQGYHNK